MCIKQIFALNFLNSLRGGGGVGGGGGGDGDKFNLLPHLQLEHGTALVKVHCSDVSLIQKLYIQIPTKLYYTPFTALPML